MIRLKEMHKREINKHTLISDITESKPPISCQVFGIFNGSINSAAIDASYSVS